MAKTFQVDTGGTLTTGLVSYYQLEGATDYFSTNDLTNNNSVSFSAGKVNNGAFFSGSNYLSKSAPNLTTTGQLFLSTWVYLPSTNCLNVVCENGGFATHSGNGAGFTVFVGGNNLATGNDLRILVWSRLAATLKTGVGTGWHHIMVVHNADNTWIGYVDNVAGTATDAAIPITPDGTDHFYIGYSDHNNYSSNGCGVDEFSMWTKVPATQERTDLYNSGNGQTMTEGATSAIKTINGLAIASVKTNNGLAVASRKTWNGLA